MYARARMRLGIQGAWLYLKGLIHSEDSYLMPLTAKETETEDLVDATLIFIGIGFKRLEYLSVMLLQEMRTDEMD